MTCQPGFKEKELSKPKREGYHYKFLESDSPSSPESRAKKEIKYINLALNNGYKYGHSDECYTHLIKGVDQNRFNTVE